MNGKSGQPRSLPWTAHVITLFPEMFPGPLGTSLAGRALEQGIWRLLPVALRDFGRGPHRNVDDTPAGGGPGMILRADVMADAIDSIGAGNPEFTGPFVALSPRGRPLNQEMVRKFADSDGLALICGRFEGIDERVLGRRDIEEVSIGDYVLSGGEPAAMVLIDAVVRLLPGVVGDAAVLEDESFEAGLLEYPQYTRPPVWEGEAIPDVLLSGHHKRIGAWRQARAEELTRRRRPDMWRRYRTGGKEFKD